MSNYTQAPILSAEELSAWRGFLRAHATLTRQLDAELAGTHGLPLSSYDVLRCLADAPGGRMRMSDVADSVLLSRSGLSRLVDRLQRDGLLERVQCDLDGRGFFAAITATGRQVLEAAQDTYLYGVRRVFAGRLSEQQLRSLSDAFERLHSA